MKKIHLKQFCSVFLSAILLATTIPISTFAAEPTPIVEDQSTFFTKEIISLIEADQKEIKEQGHGNLIIPKELHNISLDVIPDNAMYVAQKLHDNGYEAYFIGGCIRDVILGYPSMDYDITSNISYDEAAKLFGKDFHLHYSGANAYGGVTVNGELIDLATYSSLPDFMYGVKGMPDPSVRNLITDAFQRDLPINAIYYDPFKEEILDFDSITTSHHNIIYSVLSYMRVEELAGKIGLDAAIDQTVNELILGIDISKDSQLEIKRLLTDMYEDNQAKKVA